MSIDHGALILTLRSPLDGAAGVDASTIVWENRSASAPDGDATYIEEIFIPFGEAAAGSDVDRLVGEYRLTVNMPRGAGTIAGRALAVTIKDLYPIGSCITGAVNAVVERSELLSGRVKNDNRYAIPVAVTVRVEGAR